MSSPLGNSGIDQRKILPLVSLEFRCSFSRIDISLQHSSAFVLTVDMTCKLYKIEENSDLFNRECKLIDAQCDEINKTLLDISMPLEEHLLDFSEPNPTSHDPKASNTGNTNNCLTISVC
jgi:hypothetical protein